MPFTPFHFGPAAIVRAIFPRHFSFTVFCFAQVIVDAEVLVYMARADGPLHRHMHTYAGATAAALVALFAGRPLCRSALRVWSSTPGLTLKEFFDFDSEIPFVAAFTGAFAGTYSHVFLDSMLYRDMTPLVPFGESNPAFGWIGPGMLYGLCFVSGVIGGWLCARGQKRKT
jgi:hypothetical protein